MLLLGNWTNVVRIVPNSAVKFLTYEQLSRCALMTGFSTPGLPLPIAHLLLLAFKLHGLSCTIA